MGKKKKKSGKRIALARFAVEEIMDMHRRFNPGQTIPVFKGDDGKSYKARVHCPRLRTFAKGTRCVKCGLAGEFFQLERMTDAPPGIAHLNLYGLRNGEPILFTKDHILPRAQGGANCVSNMQPMCVTCNHLKGARPEHRYRLKVYLPYVKGAKPGYLFKEFGCDEEYALRAAKALLFDAGVSNELPWQLHFWEPDKKKWVGIWSQNDPALKGQAA